jgi:hypothetical protein
MFPLLAALESEWGVIRITVNVFLRLSFPQSIAPSIEVI